MSPHALVLDVTVRIFGTTDTETRLFPEIPDAKACIEVSARSLPYGLADQRIPEGDVDAGSMARTGKYSQPKVRYRTASFVDSRHFAALGWILL